MPSQQVVDAFKASYGVDNAIFAVSQIAQTTMVSSDPLMHNVPSALLFTPTRLTHSSVCGCPTPPPQYMPPPLPPALQRSELGKITLDKTFEEREALNASIVQTINAASEAWGLQCLRYEIRSETRL